MIIEIKVKPNSRDEKIIFGKEIIAHVKAPAEKGKANAALLKLLKKTFGSARIVSGAATRHKRVEIPQQSLEEAGKAIG